MRTALLPLPLGRLVVTPGVRELLLNEGRALAACLERHRRDDWGELDAEDRQTNEAALLRELRVLSAYTLPSGIRFWIITEADRTRTTLLLPEEY